MRARAAVAVLLAAAATAGPRAAWTARSRPVEAWPRGAAARARPGGGSPQDTTCESRVTWRYLPSQPQFTPFTQPPWLVDRAAAQAAVQSQYPPALRAAGTTGRTMLWVFVDECGRVRVVRIRTSSGIPALDSAAVRAVNTFRFSPALEGRFPTPVWISLPIFFGQARVALGAPSPHSDTLRVPGRVRTDVLLRFPAPPGFAGPTLRNESEIIGRLEERYAPFRAEGVRGTVALALHLDAAGRVTAAAIAQSSTYTELDDLALGVARGMVFFPAVDPHRRYSSVTTTVPIRFGP